MKLSLDPVASAPRHITAMSVALAAWYDAHPSIRRLWAVKDAYSLSVIVTLEPTMDGNDTYPAWFACRHGWMREIQSITDAVVNLELLDEPAVEEFDIDLEGEIIAAISWRDPTYLWIAD